MQPAVGPSPAVNEARRKFFATIYGESASGYACIGSKEADVWRQEFFAYPGEMVKLLDACNRHTFGRNAYVCAHLLKTPKDRKKPNAAKECRSLWADLDEFPPTDLKPVPSIVVETSPERYQGYWLLKEPLPPTDAEDLNHRIYYHHKIKDDGREGVDSGWALGKMLRLINSYNLKYASIQPVPIVHIVEELSPLTVYTPDDFSHLPVVPGFDYMDTEIPVEANDLTGKQVLEQYKDRLDNRASKVFEGPPNGDFSTALWNLECYCVEAGMTPTEAFVVARDSAVNKYARDNRPQLDLWREVGKAFTVVPSMSVYKSEVAPSVRLPPLLTTDERTKVPTNTFVDRFTNWAKSRTDAPAAYHEASAFIILSTLLCARMHLPTSSGNLVPNLWIMLIGPSTIARKTTGLEMAKHLLTVADEDAILATDGSLEGIITALQTRSGRASVFFKDEFSGFLAGSVKKEYMAGMLETLTQLYDSTLVRRVLSKQTIEVRNPRLILFAGGVRTRILEHLELQHIMSGFAARFIYVDAETKFENLRPLGPPTQTQDKTRDKLEEELTSLVRAYDQNVLTKLKVQGETKPLPSNKRVWEARLTPDAWERYNQLEHTMLQSAEESDLPDLYFPMFDRLSKSILKCAVLLAASRQDPTTTQGVTVTLIDILKAISYGEKWRVHTVYVTENAGSTMTERKLATIYHTIKKSPGITRSSVMTVFHLNSKEADLLLDTLEQRAAIFRARTGKKGVERLYDSAAKPSVAE